MKIWDALLEGFGQLLTYFYGLVPNYGVAIIMLTVAIRAAMIPLAVKQYRSMEKMRTLQPEIKKLQAKYKGKENRQKLNEEMMALYKQHGASPLGGGCLPLVLQLPIFLALYRVLDSCRGEAKAAGECVTGLRYLPAGTALYRAIEVGSASFLGMNLVQTPQEAVTTLGVLGSIPYLFLLLMMAATTYLQTKQTQAMQSPDAPGAAAAKTMSRVMPVMLLFFSYTFPAGLTVYWTTSNLWSMGQQQLLMSRAPGGGKAAAAVGNPAGNPSGGEDPDEPRKPAPPRHKGSGARKKRRKR
jgi:YidC/Oxa1 family membrane protein insertase